MSAEQAALRRHKETLSFRPKQKGLKLSPLLQFGDSFWQDERHQLH
jgi:hypothetical protein